MPLHGFAALFFLSLIVLSHTAETPCSATCDAYAAVPNGIITYKPSLLADGEVPLGTVATLTCKTGYAPLNEEETTTTCSSAPSYSPCLTSCVATCIDPKTLFVDQDDKTTTLSTTGIQDVGSVVIVTCGTDDTMFGTIFDDGTLAVMNRGESETLILFCNPDGKYYTRFLNEFTEDGEPVRVDGTVSTPGQIVCLAAEEEEEGAVLLDVNSTISAL